MKASEEWRDGFLFLANQLSLDFLNTRPVVDGVETEYLVDERALIRWLVAAGLVERSDVSRLIHQWASKAGLKELLNFRESWRRVVCKLEQGESPSQSFIKHLNELLLEHPVPDQVIRLDGTWIKRPAFAPLSVEDVLGPLAASVATLLTEADWTKLRKCPTCVLHFFDISKKGTRRWCSMNMCGNRAKVAAYAVRKKKVNNDQTTMT